MGGSLPTLAPWRITSVFKPSRRAPPPLPLPCSNDAGRYPMRAPSTSSRLNDETPSSIAGEIPHEQRLRIPPVAPSLFRRAAIDADQEPPSTHDPSSPSARSETSTLALSFFDHLE